jgi:hypothetical protein
MVLIGVAALAAYGTPAPPAFGPFKTLIFASLDRFFQPHVIMVGSSDGSLMGPSSQFPPELRRIIFERNFFY